METNILGTQVMMDACRKYGVERFHQVGTDEVYGNLPLDRPDLFFHEDTPISTSSPYSTSKANEELGWRPTTMFADGIKRTIKWYKEHMDWIQECVSGEYVKYYEEMYGKI